MSTCSVKAQVISLVVAPVRGLHTLQRTVEDFDFNRYRTREQGAALIPTRVAANCA